jgi:predicted ATPase
MKFDRIEVRGFKSIREIQVDLRPLNILIGANGAGKSNFVDAFRMLSEMMQGRLQLYVAQSGGADALLHYGQKVTTELNIKVELQETSYLCALVPTADDRLVFGEDALEFREEKFLFSEGSIRVVDAGAGHRESGLNGLTVPLKYLLSREELVSGMAHWRVYHFHDTGPAAPIKKKRAINDDMYLRPDGENLAAFFLKLRNTAQPQYEAIRDTIRLVAPFFDDFILRPLAEDPDRIRLEWREPGSDYPFLAHHLSDGTLRFICLATLLLQPDLPATILIDEPELGLHPYAINVIASLMRTASIQSQLIVSTQSVSLVNQFAPEDLLVVERHERETTIRREDPRRLNEWLEDYSLGELWEKNVLGGRPSR